MLGGPFVGAGDVGAVVAESASDVEGAHHSAAVCHGEGVEVGEVSVASFFGFTGVDGSVFGVGLDGFEEPAACGFAFVGAHDE